MQMLPPGGIMYSTTLWEALTIDWLSMFATGDTAHPPLYYCHLCIGATRWGKWAAMRNCRHGGLCAHYLLQLQKRGLCNEMVKI